MQIPLRTALTAVACSVLFGCGGGGDSSGGTNVNSLPQVADGSARAAADTLVTPSSVEASTTTTTTTIAASTTTTLPPPYSEGVDNTWREARVYLPQSTAKNTLEAIPDTARYAVAIFLHGCAGMASDEHANWGTFLAVQGLLVIMPDSFARPQRQDSCGDLADGGGPIPQIHDMRLEEIRYAVEQIRRQAWFDGKNLFLMGYSEGAIAAVRTTLSGFSGVIATSWTCTHKTYPPLNGIRLPLETPLLTMLHESDNTWFPSPIVQGNCGEHMAGHIDAKNLMVAGEGHATYHDERVRLAVADFIRRLLQVN